jgi:ferredoxin-NADP reductase
MTDASEREHASSQWQTAKVVDIVQRTPRIKSFVFNLPKPFSYRAGQHVDVSLTAPDGYRAVRSYSIASAPIASSRIELAIELLEKGEVSPFFHETVAVGDDIELRGPLGGHFVWSTSDGGPILLVGGGSGVVPLISMIRHRQAAAAQVPVVLLVSARHWNDVLYRDELIELSRLGSDLNVVLTLTRQRSRRVEDYDRRVDDRMMTDLLSRLPCGPKYVFVCGSNAFVNAAADGLVSAGVPPSAIRTERYGA